MAKIRGAYWCNRKIVFRCRYDYRFHGSHRLSIDNIGVYRWPHLYSLKQIKISIKILSVVMHSWSGYGIQPQTCSYWRVWMDDDERLLFYNRQMRHGEWLVCCSTRNSTHFNGCVMIHLSIHIVYHGFNDMYYNMTSRVILLHDRFFPREVAGISLAPNVIISARAGIVARVVTLFKQLN